MLHGSVPLIMGTRLDALIFGSDPVKLETVWQESLAEIRRLHAMLNRFDPDSELSLLSKKAPHEPSGMSDELWNILLDCRNYHALTEGYFDITLADFTRAEFDQENHTLFYHDKTLMLDLGGYAKGYAMQKIRNLLISSGVMQAFFNFGNSSVMTLGRHPSGKPWMIGIDDPFHPGQQLGTVELGDQALSTSGNLPNHRPHLVDPHTRKQFSGRKVVSVVSGNDTEAEILSTALLLAGTETAERIKRNFENITVYTFNIQ